MSEEEIAKRLLIAYHEAQKHKRKTADQMRFELNCAENLMQLKEDIIYKKYKPSRSVAFIIRDPKMREIFAAPFRDRIMHHFICDLIVPWWEKRLQPCAYSCRKNKGTDAGRRDFYAKARKVSQNFTIPISVVKIDISSYFCSIPRKQLQQRVQWGLKQQFLVGMGGERGKRIYGMLDYLTKQIIFDNPIDGVRIKGAMSDWEEYPRHKSLFFQVKGKGIVIGNYTSQVFSNIFMDQLDRFCRIELGIWAYGRYVDDAFFIMRSSEVPEFFRNKMPAIRDFVNGMGLKLNEKKTTCQDFRHGVEFLGAIMGPGHILPGNRMKKNFDKTVREVISGEKDPDCLVSYLGQMRHYNAQKLVKKIFERNGLDYDKDFDGGADFFGV